MRGPDSLQPFGAGGAQLLGLERHGAAVLAEHPAGERLDRRVVGLEDAVDELARVGQRPVHPPGDLPGDLDPRRAGDRPVLPVLADAVQIDVEVGRQLEVALAPRREADVAADARDPERADVVVVEILADDVPGAAVAAQRVRVERPLADGVASRRPVAELDRALLRDRRLELRQAAGHLGRVVGIAHLDARGRVRRRVVEARAAEGEVLEREPQRLGVRERAVEHVERRLERRELVVVELELVEEVVLGAERVELLAGELVALRVERDAERDQLGAVGVEAARERLVRHLGVALDVALHVAGGQRPALRHQEGDERELPDQLVRVVGHRARAYRSRDERPGPRDVRGSMPRRASARGAGGTGSSRVPAAACAGTACPCAWSRGSGRPRRRARRPRAGPR